MLLRRTQPRIQKKLIIFLEPYPASPKTPEGFFTEGNDQSLIDLGT